MMMESRIHEWAQNKYINKSKQRNALISFPAASVGVDVMLAAWLHSWTLTLTLTPQLTFNPDPAVQPIWLEIQSHVQIA